jgi:endo-1,4-beta-D-glucanase Y
MRQVFIALAIAALTAASTGCSSAVDPTPISCPAGTWDCGGGVCIAVAADPNNCGTCGTVCQAGGVCSNGQCATSCNAGLSACNGGCIDPAVDPNNCGVCGTICSSGTCAGGLCSAPPVPANWYGFVTSSISLATVQADYEIWKSRFLVACGTNELAVIQDNTTQAVVSEGIAYGMLIAVAMGDQPTFNGLFNYYWHRRDFFGLMNWKYSGCGTTPTADGSGSATDADLDAFMALLQAEKRWPGNNYTTQFANPLIGAILAKETTTCNGRFVLLAGDGWGQSGCTATTNPSYYTPAYFHILAIKDPGSAAMWNQYAADSYALLSTNAASAPNGLFTDWSNGSGVPIAGNSSIQYGYDACRTPWRIAMDYAWTGDPQAKAALAKVATYVSSVGGPMEVSYYGNSAFVGAFALSGLALDQATYDTWIKSWLDRTLDSAYFPSTLRMLYLLVAIGAFDSTL